MARSGAGVRLGGGAAMFYIASLQGENPIRDPFDIWNAERAAYCESYVAH